MQMYRDQEATENAGAITAPAFSIGSNLVAYVT